MLKRRSELFIIIAMLLDALFAASAWMGCYAFRFHSGLLPVAEAGLPPATSFLRLLPLVILCDWGALAIIGLYKSHRTRTALQEGMHLARGAVLGWLFMLATFYYVSATPYSRRMLGLFFIANILALALSRHLFQRIVPALLRRGIGVCRAALIGTGRLGQEALLRFRNHPWLGIEVAYFIDHREAVRRAEVHGVPVRAALPDMVECLRQSPVDIVFIAVPGSAGAEERILRELLDLPLKAAVIPDFSRAAPLTFSVGELDGMPIIHLRDSPIVGWRSSVKRVIDIVGASLLLALFCAPMLLLAVLVKLTSKGPVLFRQERMGLGGKPFMLLKFRSMAVDAESHTGPVWARPDDPRCTRIGRIMRMTSFDELPQLFNILRGDMSLVGPRPERPHFVRQFTQKMPGYMLRHHVKAGLTGWAQVNGLRGNTSLRKRLQYDLYYINNWSLLFDFLIILFTPFAGLVNRNAY